MKIAIDCRTYFLRSGTGRFSRGLINALLDFQDYDFHVLISNHKMVSDFPRNGNHITVQISAATLSKPEEEYRLADELRASQAEVAYFPFFFSLEETSVPVVSTILDLSTIRYPGMHLKENVDYINGHIDRLLRKGSPIVTISRFSRDEILDYARSSLDSLSSPQVYVAYPGVDSCFFREQDDDTREAELRSLGLQPGEYILFVGSIEPRKNLETLLDAYDICRSGNELSLVVAGMPRWGEDAFQRKLDTVSRRQNIKTPGFVAEELLPMLYAKARMLVYPSLYEGFGLPIVEAYAADTPVICHNQGAPAEIGTSAVRVDCTDRQALAAAMDDLHCLSELRENCVREGRASAKKFSWQNTARTVLDVLKVAHHGNS